MEADPEASTVRTDGAAKPGTPVMLNSTSPVYASKHSHIDGKPVSPPPIAATSTGG